MQRVVLVSQFLSLKHLNQEPSGPAGPWAGRSPEAVARSRAYYAPLVKLSFILTQSNRDEYLIKSLIEYLGCGNTSLDPRGTIDFKVTNFSSIKDIIVPFFIKYPLKPRAPPGFSPPSSSAGGGAEGGYAPLASEIKVQISPIFVKS